MEEGHTLHYRGKAYFCQTTQAYCAHTSDQNGVSKNGTRPTYTWVTKNATTSASGWQYWRSVRHVHKAVS
jgi:hypothetical protein